MTDIHNPSLGFGFGFRDLYNADSLYKIDNKFLSYLKVQNKHALDLLMQYRSNSNISRLEYSNLISLVSPCLEEFIIDLFQIYEAVSVQRLVHLNFKKIYDFKRNFVQRKVLNKYKNYNFSSVNVSKLEKEIKSYCSRKFFSQETFIDMVNNYSLDPTSFAEQLEKIEQFIAWNCLVEKREYVRDWIIFNIPKKKDYAKLIDFKREKNNDIEIIKLKDEDIELRDGFNLTDDGGSQQEALDQAHYCIYCHKQQRDSCSKGVIDKDGSFKENSLEDVLKGCPLDEKISEMNELKAAGLLIAALGVAIIDNPMLAATGHRICNDCMKSCIYQTQDPVNVPKVETRILQDVLNLPWGFEIYSLLTRWNPLNVFNPYPKKESGKKILVVGMGPAGFTLAHYLLNLGHIVIGIDGLKIEPLDVSWSGKDFVPIKDISILYEDLEKRKPYGFGGVTEYGITVRWNKNFLTIIRMLLERRKNFSLFGGIRFGGNLDWRKAFELGFDHIALAIGAGKPSILDIPNAVALGVRTASDFLMSLQLSGASQKHSISNLQIRLPVVVIGGGLTAIDTATEVQAYYVRQVEKLYERYQKLCENYDKKFVEEYWLDIDREIAAEFFDHAQRFIQERNLAQKEKRKPNFNLIIKELGGVRILYRKPIESSPSYRLNHEELELALKEGIEFVENVSPKKFITDQHGHIQSVEADINGSNIELRVRTVLVAIGTSSNVTLSEEDKNVFKVENGYFKLLKPQKDNFSIFRNNEGKSITIFGDLHPHYKGNVVKAMSSAKDGYKVIDHNLLSIKSGHSDHFPELVSNYLSAKVYKVNKLAKGIVEIIIHSPSAAQNFHPGQFYRLQNFISNSKQDSNTGSVLTMEGIALTGAWVDKEKSLISTVVLEMGGSSDLCRYLSPGENVVLMGPTGTPTEIIPNINVILVGGGLGNAVLFSIGNAFREMGSKVLYFAGYRDKQCVFMQDNVEKAADQVIWCCDNADIIPRREKDFSFRGNIVDAIKAYAAGEISGGEFDLSSIDRMIVIGSDKMMKAVQALRQEIQALSKTSAVASINSPMQCMMKEICAQCLQKHVDPMTGIESYVYSCTNQDQDMNKVDFIHLSDRLKQNSLQEKVTSKWIQHILQM